jgi:hypothetical protein
MFIFKKGWEIFKDKLFAPLATGLANIYLGASTCSFKYHDFG